MLDSVKLKMLKKQAETKDKEISDLLDRNSKLEEENASLRTQIADERSKLEDAAGIAADTIKEYRDKILEAEKLHQKFLRLVEGTNKINDDYRTKFEELIRLIQKTEEGN